MYSFVVVICNKALKSHQIDYNIKGVVEVSIGKVYKVLRNLSCNEINEAFKSSNQTLIEQHCYHKQNRPI